MKYQATDNESDECKDSNTNESDSDINVHGGVAEQHESTSEEDGSAISGCIDTVKVSSGHLIRLKCKAGVTQTLLPSIVEMNEAVDSVLTNISSEVMEKLQANSN